ncbi:MAG: GntR family transcriptional regulator [Galactobacter sp.]
MNSPLESFRPDPASTVPPYEQLRRRIAADIAAGEIAVGEKLPSVRALAVAVGMAPNTVAKVYKGLEADGLVRTAGRAGTEVTGKGAKAPAGVLRAAERLASEARRAGLSDDAVLAVTRAALNAAD